MGAEDALRGAGGGAADAALRGDAELRRERDGGGDPAASFVFEDSFSGLQAGLTGGFITIALATTNTREQLEPVGAHRIVKDLSEVDPQWLARGRLG